MDITHHAEHSLAYRSDAHEIRSGAYEDRSDAYQEMLIRCKRLTATSVLAAVIHGNSGHDCRRSNNTLSKTSIRAEPVILLGGSSIHRKE